MCLRSNFIIMSLLTGRRRSYSKSSPRRQRIIWCAYARIFIIMVLLTGRRRSYSKLAARCSSTFRRSYLIDMMATGNPEIQVNRPRRSSRFDQSCRLAGLAMRLSLAFYGQMRWWSIVQALQLGTRIYSSSSVYHAQRYLHLTFQTFELILNPTVNMPSNELWRCSTARAAIIQNLKPRSIPKILCALHQRKSTGDTQIPPPPGNKCFRTILAAIVRWMMEWQKSIRHVAE